MSVGLTRLRAAAAAAAAGVRRGEAKQRLCLAVAT